MSHVDYISRETYKKPHIQNTRVTRRNYTPSEVVWHVDYLLNLPLDLYKNGTL